MSTSNSNTTLMWGISTFLVLAALGVGFYIGKNSSSKQDVNPNIDEEVRTETRVDTVFETLPPEIRIDTVYETLPPEPQEATKPSLSISADKMNVLYIGVENPITVNAPGVSSNDLRVTGTDLGIRRVGSDNYTVTANRPGEQKITASANGHTKTQPFRVKRIPDPVARLSRSTGGKIGSGEFKAQGGVGAFLDNFDFDAICRVSGYTLTYIAKRQDPVESNNAGARYNDKSSRLIRNAKPGDIYLFTNIKAKCPGDNASRAINSMAFQIQ